MDARYCHAISGKSNANFSCLPNHLPVHLGWWWFQFMFSFWPPFFFLHLYYFHPCFFYGVACHSTSATMIMYIRFSCWMKKSALFSVAQSMKYGICKRSSTMIIDNNFWEWTTRQSHRVRMKNYFYMSCSNFDSNTRSMSHFFLVYPFVMHFDYIFIIISYSIFIRLATCSLFQLFFFDGCVFDEDITHFI